MKRILFIALLGGIGFTTVQCTKTIEERVEVIRERGNAILSGNGVPDASLGKVGDYYLDLSGVNLYGAKTAEGWGNPISLRGLKGDKGNDGQNGTDAPVPNIKGGYWYIGETNTGIKAEGKDGKDGNNGNNGKTPYIGNNGNWFVDGQDLGVKAKGEKGNKGDKGVNGKTPYIGNNGNWFVDGQDLGVKAKGEKGNKGDKGADGETPRVGNNGNWFIGNHDTGVKAQGEKGNKGDKGADGETPRVGNNGNWFVGNHDTGVKAQGEKGNKGDKGADGETPRVGNNGNWFVGNYDTGVKAQGDKGADGAKGEDGKDAPKPNIKNGYWYIGEEKTEVKATGAQGERGERGLPGKDGSVIYADKGKPTTQGKDGDYYIDTEAKIFYGPKANNTWPTTGISLTNESINNSDYELSGDGKTLIKWLNPKTHYIDMNTDPKLKEVETIAKDAFNAEKNNLAYELRTFIIGDKVKEIQTYAFYQCLRLTSVELSNENITRNITKIATLTFGNCTHLQNVDIPASVTTIETRAFIGCDRLTSIILPDKVNSIAANAFMKCKNLHTVIIQNPQAFSISTTAFNQTLLRNIYVPNGKANDYKTANPTYKDIIR